MRKYNYLLPSVYRRIGWCLLPLFASMVIFIDDDLLTTNVFAIISNNGNLIGDFAWFKVFKNSIWDEIMFIGLAISLLMISFSKEKDEDECIERLRLESLVWSVVATYAIFIFATMFIYDEYYMTFAFASSFILLSVFIIIFRTRLYFFRKRSEK